MLHRRHHVGEAGASWVKVEIGHAVDGRPVPTSSAGIGNAWQPCARLRSDATQTAQQNAITNQIFATGRLTVIVKRIAGELFRLGRVIGDIEEVGAVAITAEHIWSDETGASIVALIAENAIEFQRMADGLVDLQDHLIGRKQDIHRTRGTVGRGQQLECFGSDAGGSLTKVSLIEDFETPLTAVTASSEAPCLGLAASVGGCAQHRHDIAKELTRAPTVSGEI